MAINFPKIIISVLALSATLFYSSLLQAQFTIMPNSYITIKEGSTLKIGTDLNVNSTAAGSGYLVDQTVGGDVAITGNISVKRYMTADYWHNTSSPVSSGNSSLFTGTELVYYYDETLIINDWMFGWVLYSGALTVMRGYDVYFENNPVTVNYTATGTQTLNTGSYSTAVARTWFDNGESGPRKGWNFVGNPYPSPVDWQHSSGWDKSDINDAKYIWDGPNDNYTIFLGGGSPIGINGGTRYIPSNQGFWVQATQNGTIQINNSTRIGETPATPDYYKNTTVEYPLLDLVARANGFTDECIIRFLPETSHGFDLNYDATKLISQGETVPQIWTLSDNAALAINSLPALENELMIPLGFQCNKEGYATIEIKEITNLNPFITIYLKDELENKIINLTDDFSYGFYHKPTNVKARFKVYFNPSNKVIENLDPDDYFSVFANNGQLSIIKNTSQLIEGDITVYTALGQPVYHNTLSNDKKCSFNILLATGYYLVSIQTQHQASNYKVFFK